ncbi:MAG TPA: ornithine cyclodeaminase family protein [Selenomonadales bacterium]|nr:ornithine cyclodeaminase family protein [Selenomonadales bacterium]
MLLLSKKEMQSVFSMKDAVQAAKEAFVVYSAGKANIPLRINLDVAKHHGQTLFMPGYIEEINCSGLKVVSVFPGNAAKGRPTTPATMLVVSGETGEVAAILDGTYLTQLRTGAVAGAATDLLARKDASAGALIGTGGQAAAQLEAMLTVRNLTTVKVFSLNAEHGKQFVDRMQIELACYGAAISLAGTAAEAIAGADIITTVTTAKSPTFDGRLVKPGAHINAVGSYTPQMQELDEYILVHADKFFVDAKEAAVEETGDIIIPLRKGIINEGRIAGEIGQLLQGQVAGRQNAAEITVFKTVGLAVFDIMTAKRILDKALEAKVGTAVSFN